MVLLRTAVRWFTAAWIVGMLIMVVGGLALYSPTVGEVLLGTLLVAVFSIPFVVAACCVSLAITGLFLRIAGPRVEGLAAVVPALVGGTVMHLGLPYQDLIGWISAVSIGAVAATTGHMASQAKGATFSREWLMVSLAGVGVGGSLAACLQLIAAAVRRGA